MSYRATVAEGCRWSGRTMCLGGINADGSYRSASGSRPRWMFGTMPTHLAYRRRLRADVTTIRSGW